MIRFTLAVAFAASLVACGPPHVAPFTPRHRLYKPGEYAQSSAKPATGSLFSEANAGFLEDTRARRVGDVVVVNIDENADAQGQATTKLNRTSSMTTSAEAVLGIMPALKKAHPNVDPKQLLAWASAAQFDGAGNTARSNALTANIAVRVAKEMPNGDLFLEGTKVLLINNEELHLYISGLVRPADIAQDNSVASSRIADAQVEFTGRGDVADQQRKGWFSRAIDAVNPF